MMPDCKVLCKGYKKCIKSLKENVRYSNTCGEAGFMLAPLPSKVTPVIVSNRSH